MGGGERDRDLSVKLERSARSRRGKDGEGVKNSGLATGNEYNITCLKRGGSYVLTSQVPPRGRHRQIIAGQSQDLKDISRAQTLHRFLLGEYQVFYHCLFFPYLVVE